MYRYYSTQRPCMPGAIPTGASNIKNFDERTYCGGIGREAWGYAEYETPLTAEQVEQYELTSTGMKLYYCVRSAVSYDTGRITSQVVGSKYATSKPGESHTRTEKRYMHYEWFDRLDDAEKYAAAINE